VEGSRFHLTATGGGAVEQNETHRQTTVSKNRVAPLDQKVYSFLKTAVEGLLYAKSWVPTKVVSHLIGYLGLAL
jgi:hypothetical protein